MSQIRRVTSPGAPEPPPDTWSNCLVVGNTAYIAGLTARSPDGSALGGLDDYAQAKAIFAKIQALVEAAGGSMADVVKINVYVTDIRRREQIWEARQEFFTGNFPVSTLVEASKLADPAITVEIEAVAHLGASG
jgi:2-iminobutanoate/2-iminopropanoate deaminase